MRFKNYLLNENIPLLTEEDEIYSVTMLKRKKNRKLNPKTNRYKNFKKIQKLDTSISPEKRELKNLPRYADKSPKVHFKDWLEIDAKSLNNGDVKCWGWSSNGKCYGWSHRAIYGFKVGDKIKQDTIGNNTGKEFTLKTNKEVENMAQKFAKDVS